MHKLYINTLYSNKHNSTPCSTAMQPKSVNEESGYETKVQNVKNANRVFSDWRHPALHGKTRMMFSGSRCSVVCVSTLTGGRCSRQGLRINEKVGAAPSARAVLCIDCMSSKVRSAVLSRWSSTGMRRGGGEESSYTVSNVPTAVLKLAHWWMMVEFPLYECHKWFLQ